MFYIELTVELRWQGSVNDIYYDILNFFAPRFYTILQYSVMSCLKFEDKMKKMKIANKCILALECR